MKAQTISIYVGGKLVLRAGNLVYDEKNGKSLSIFPPGMKFKGSVGKVLTLEVNGNVTEAAADLKNSLEIVCEI